MSEQAKYNVIEFNGLALNPSFSIYLFEIMKGREKFFYVGITGDSHYPSARSILHRLAGHIDLNKKSTQSQFIKALKEKVFQAESITDKHLEQINIKLHYWPIPGFQTWEGNLNELDKESEKYKSYKVVQQKVLDLENKIIGDFEEILLNKTKGKSGIVLKDPYFQNIYENIKNIIKQ